MKKISAIMLTVCMLFSACFISGCAQTETSNKIEPTKNNYGGYNQTETSNKIELTEENYSEYITIEASIKVDNLNLKKYGEIYLINGEATLTLTVRPDQPIKCYNVQIDHENISPYEGYGMSLTLEETPTLIIPSDGNLTTKAYKINITTGDAENLRQQILWFGRGEEEFIEWIEQPFTYMMLAEKTSFSGYVTVE